MIRFAVSFVSRRTDHPLLSGLFAIAALFLIGAIVAGQPFGNEMAEGFLTVYAVMAAAMGAIGYSLVIAAKLLSRVLRRYEHPAVSG